MRIYYCFLIQVVHQKPKKSLDEISHQLCPVSGNHKLPKVDHLSSFKRF